MVADEFIEAVSTRLRLSYPDSEVFVSALYFTPQKFSPYRDVVVLRGEQILLKTTIPVFETTPELEDFLDDKFSEFRIITVGPDKRKFRFTGNEWQSLNLAYNPPRWEPTPNGMWPPVWSEADARLVLDTYKNYLITNRSVGRGVKYTFAVDKNYPTL